MKFIKWIRHRIEEKRKRRNKAMLLLDEKSVNDWLELYQENLSKPPQERCDNSAE